MMCCDTGMTRFGTNFIMLTRLKEVKRELQAMVVDELWEAWVEKETVQTWRKQQMNASDWSWTTHTSAKWMTCSAWQGMSALTFTGHCIFTEH